MARVQKDNIEAVRNELAKLSGGHIDDNGIGSKWYGDESFDKMSDFDLLADMYKNSLNISPKILKLRMQEAEHALADAADSDAYFGKKLNDTTALTSCIREANTTKMAGVIMRALTKQSGDARSLIVGEIGYMKEKYPGYDYTKELPIALVDKIGQTIAMRRRRD